MAWWGRRESWWGDWDYLAFWSIAIVLILASLVLYWQQTAPVANSGTVYVELQVDHSNGTVQQKAIHALAAESALDLFHSEMGIDVRWVGARAVPDTTRPGSWMFWVNNEQSAVDPDVYLPANGDRLELRFQIALPSG